MPKTRDNVFQRVEVDHLIEGGTRVNWSLRPHFKEVGPYTYQLQVGSSGVTTADDWAAIGQTAEDVYQIIDYDKHAYGKRQTTHYRIKLTTSEAIHYSHPAATYGLLDKQDWLIARAVVRRERLRHEKKTSPNGFLLKRKWVGTVVDDPDVVDPLTGEVIKSKNTEGKGTEFVGGYYSPVEMFIDLSPEVNYVQLDPNRGTVNDIEIQGRALAYPQLNHKDIWVHGTSDKRYVIHRVQNIAEVRAVPIIVQLTMRPVPFKDPVYEIDMANSPRSARPAGITSTAAIGSMGVGNLMSSSVPSAETIGAAQVS